MPETKPRLWLVVGDKAGDNAQVRAIAEALGWPAEWKVLHFKPPFVKGKPEVKASLHHVDAARSDPLTPPWPDLVITVGRRPTMAALWIKQQSGGKTRIVLLGRPRRGWEPYDLILVPLQYRLPPHPKVVPMGLPALFPPLDRIRAAGASWQPRLAHLPRPLVAVLVGGTTKPYRFDSRVAEDLVAGSRALAGQGSLYFCTSRRTPPEVVEALRRSGEPVYAWMPEDRNNPYLGLLALADAFVVTGDSISMQVEVARLKKPLVIYPLPVEHPFQRAVYRRVAEMLYRPGASTWAARLAQRIFETGWLGYLRELERVHAYLYDRKLAAPLAGGKWPAPAGDVDLPDAVSEVAKRIRALFDGEG